MRVLKYFSLVVLALLTVSIIVLTCINILIGGTSSELYILAIGVCASTVLYGTINIIVSKLKHDAFRKAIKNVDINNNLKQVSDNVTEIVAADRRGENISCDDALDSIKLCLDVIDVLIKSR